MIAPWNTLGFKITAGNTPKILRTAGLNWRVIKAPIFASFDKQRIPIQNRSMLLRDNGEPLSVISPNWMPTQNDEAFDLFQQFAETGNMELTYAGALKSGHMVWGLAKTPWSFEGAHSYALLTNPHEYGKTMDVRYLAMLPDMSSIVTTLAHGTLRTTHRSELNTETAGATIADMRNAHERIVAAFNAMNNIPINEPDREALFKTVFRGGRPASIAASEMHVTNGTTWWDAVRAVATVIDHKLGYSADTRLASAWYGVNRVKKERAMKMALAATS